MTTKQDKDSADFGFTKVDREEKASLVHGVFESVASKYDVMNDFMSAGLHRLWKDKFVAMMSLADGDKALDLAGGTGDIAFRMLRKNPDIHATISDINEHMLFEGRKRAIDNNILKNIDWKIVNAEKIPFPDESFDHVTISFGIRNVTNIDKALAEIYRVLKPRGRFMCLEFSMPENPLVAKIYDTYSFNVIPAVGGLVTGDRESYQYLVESIRKFPKKQEFTQMIEGSGLSEVSVKSLTQGVVAIHSGWKL